MLKKLYEFMFTIIHKMQNGSRFKKPVYFFGQLDKKI